MATEISTGEIFIAADIFYGVGNDEWKSVPADKLFDNMVRDDAVRADIALEWAEIISADFDAYQLFKSQRMINWGGDEIISADLPKALFNGDIRRVEGAA